jgi:hypothetical protein
MVRLIEEINRCNNIVFVFLVAFALAGELLCCS